eukprot:m.143829 g.143829  ORF g.143829 m.143829 type:complete len:435 (+) comp52650_c0_seq1:41-1345(+)
MVDLSDGYVLSVIIPAIVCVALQFRSGVSSSKSSRSAAFSAFQRNYLTVYLLATFADWLKGPYVYALYVYYGYGESDIAWLFIIGFLSSLVVGTFVGGLSDKYGRKFMCIMFAVLYFIAGITTIFNNFWILMFGRFLSGVATSLLFSSFEAWMVSEHNSRNFDPELLNDTFSKATFGNGVGAVLAGLVAGAAAETWGYVAPFLICLIPLALVGIIVSHTWVENYGDQKIEVVNSLQSAWTAVKTDRKILYLGAGQAAFEGAMYTFVFMWTPALDPGADQPKPPYGIIFAAFMVCVMLGSSAQSLLSEANVAIQRMPLFVHSTALGATFVVATLIEDKSIVYLAFLVFEFSVGAFYPVYGILRSIYIPEECRAAVMNLFRVPLNAFVVLVLVKVEKMPIPSVFLVCLIAHAFALAMYFAFVSAVRATPQTLQSAP